MKSPEPVHVIKQRREGLLRSLVDGVPYIRFLGVQFDRRGDELTAVLPFKDSLIGNPRLPALHGGATAAFLEISAMIELAWSTLWDGVENDGALPAGPLRLPKTIDFTIDYLRAGLRRYASVHVEAWQDNRARLFAQATGHFLMPPAESR
jgi:acyl-coenzyme A thioesterase PaaI-like protein